MTAGSDALHAKVDSSPFPPAALRLFGPPLPAVPLDGATPAFEPAAYAAHYGDLRNMTDAQLAAHFLAAGRVERRVYRRLRVILRCAPAASRHCAVRASIARLPVTVSAAFQNQSSMNLRSPERQGIPC